MTTLTDSTVMDLIKEKLPDAASKTEVRPAPRPGLLRPAVRPAMMQGPTAAGRTRTTRSEEPGDGDAAGNRLDSDEPSIGELVKEATTQFSTVLHGEIELAKIELKSSVKNLGTGAIGFGIAAVLLLLRAAVPAHRAGRAAALAVLLALGGLPDRLRLHARVAAAAAFWAARKVKKVKAPERTIETTKSTVAALRHPHDSA